VGTTILTDPPRSSARRFLETELENPGELLSREWLVTTGSAATLPERVGGVLTRRYHALLIAALPAPLGRMVMLNQLGERVRLPGNRVQWLRGEERMGGALSMEGVNHLTEFHLEGGLPVLDLRRPRLRGREAAVPPPLSEHGPRHLSLPVRRTARFGWACVPCSRRARTRRRSIIHCPSTPELLAREGQLEVHLGTELPPVRLKVQDARARSPSTRSRRRTSTTAASTAAATRREEMLESPATSASICIRDERVTFVASTEPWDRMTAPDVVRRGCGS
jgi:hypothetical protein